MPINSNFWRLTLGNRLKWLGSNNKGFLGKGYDAFDLILEGYILGLVGGATNHDDDGVLGRDEKRRVAEDGCSCRWKQSVFLGTWYLWNKNTAP